MSRPPETTILIEDPPIRVDNWLIGIDSQFFTFSKAFKGIKSIPAGIHLFHYSSPTKSHEEQNNSNRDVIVSSSLRYGFWFQCEENDVYTITWDMKTESIIFEKLGNDSTREEKELLYRLGNAFQQMVSYPESREDWRELISYIDWELIEEFLPSDDHIGRVSTISSSKEENTVLLEVLESRNPNHVYEDTSEGELNYTIIDFKKRGPDTSSPSVITESILDKSWHLKEIFGHDLEILLGELQLTFLNFIIIGNFCSNIQWLNLLKLISTSRGFLSSNRGFTINFLNCFVSQLLKAPEEYIVTAPLVDQSIYLGIMENFTRDIFIPNSWKSDCCSKLKTSGILFELWNKIVLINKKRFAIDLSQFEKEKDDEDYEVFNINDIDENDDETPALVL